MSDSNTNLDKSKALRVQALLKVIALAEQELTELTDGSQQEFVDQSTGLTHLLQSAQSQLTAVLSDSQSLVTLFTDVFDSFPAGAALLAADGTIEAANQEWVHFSKISGFEDSLIAPGKNYLSACNDGIQMGNPAAAPILEGVGSVLRGEVDKFELVYQSHFSEDVHWYQMIARPLNSAKKTGFLVMRFDVTAQKTSEVAMRNQAEVLNMVNDAIFVVNTDDIITYANKAASDLYGWTKSELVGKPARDLIHHESATTFQHLKDFVGTNRSWSGEIAASNRKSQKVSIGARWSLVKGVDGSEGILQVHTDLSLLGKFLRAQRMETIGSISGGVAHDLNNLLTPILLMSGSIEADVNSTHASAAKNISALAEQASGLIRQLLGFARGLEGVRKDEDVSAFLKETSNLIRASLPKRIKFNVETGFDDCVINCNRVQLNQVVMNLILNARDSISGEGAINLSARKIEVGPGEVAFSGNPVPGRYLEIVVADTGCGISTSDLERVFEPFFSTKGPGGGTGLGLSTCLGIIQSHAGFIRVQSQLGKGSIFRMFLPASVKAEMSRLIGKNILVVIPDEKLRGAVADSLSHAGSNVVHAADSDAAVAEAINLEVNLDLAVIVWQPALQLDSNLVEGLRQFQPTAKFGFVFLDGNREPYFDDRTPDLHSITVHHKGDKTAGLVDAVCKWATTV
ncbi:MAG: PAS domain S-box protein [Proteobacteria bacterium]|nr:MAG: PAS domain S-box protein [Pseudomonadota bacterium]